jgi:hypothetical protein
MRRATAFAIKNAPRRLTFITPSKSAAVCSKAGFAMLMPELLTSTSMGPSEASTAATAASIELSSVTSSFVAKALPPAKRSSFANDSSASVRLAASPTAAPCSDKIFANRRPSPLEAPVTNATFPAKL